MMKKILISLIFGIMLIGSVSASFTSLGTFTQGEDVILIQLCDDCTFNNITSIMLPNSSFVLEQIEMDKVGTQYTYTLDGDYTIGEVGTYTVNGFGDDGGIEEVWAFRFTITPTGFEVSGETRTDLISTSIYALLVMGTLFFLGFIFYKTEKRNEKGEIISEVSFPLKWSFLLGSLFFYLIASNIISRAMAEEIMSSNLSNFFNFLTAVSFYALWFIGGLIFIIWFLTFLNTWLVRKNVNAMKKLEGLYA